MTLTFGGYNRLQINILCFLLGNCIKAEAYALCTSSEDDVQGAPIAPVTSYSMYTSRGGADGLTPYGVLASRLLYLTRISLLFMYVLHEKRYICLADNLRIPTRNKNKSCL